ncbi:hypothetical protein [Hoylesella oralis]|uniref:hypothetical protein n=1 Tax=Hoylesella oralis TaxID=28134 RepID=UPI0028EE57B9|nr:hypothetical protein [Hoylesella oralis]
MQTVASLFHLKYSHHCLEQSDELFATGNGIRPQFLGHRFHQPMQFISIRKQRCYQSQSKNAANAHGIGTFNGRNSSPSRLFTKAERAAYL